MIKLTLRQGCFVLAIVATLVACSGCGPSRAATSSNLGSARANLTGAVRIDGSSTVFPIADAMGEDFGKANPNVKVTVNKSGTGSGFQKFIRGEIDIATASRPITPSEEESLKAAKIEFLEVPLAYDGVCVVVNPSNTSVKSLTPADLKKAWADGSKVSTWADWHAGWPATKINFYGPTDNHGTYEYFTEAINGKKNNVRRDYQPNQDYNAIIQDVANDKDGIGYCGLNYYLENKDKVRAVAIDSGHGPVLPSEESVDNGTYAPLSRPLFIYVSKKSFSRPEVSAFLQYALGPEGSDAVREAKYVVLPRDVLDLVVKRIAGGTPGSLFDRVKPGTPVSQVFRDAK